ncbi:proline--tRNA ligase [Paenibacillus wenxiniae]|uniref:Proline--tRNA ligase n=1 Tax=Paenibacillus wenxiniae TaxID=1636843 RepID=A0ABW4RNE3_9BACL
MKQSQAFIHTSRSAPSEAEAASHQLLIRGSYIRQTAAGIYTYLPLGRRVLQRLEQLIRQAMEGAHAQELLMPAMQPVELWQQSGRHESYGDHLLQLEDRHHRRFVLGPTHEELITDLLRSELGSYRQLPVTLYQIQTKFRDESRPRSGLLRGREFLMKDAYSFATDMQDLDDAYLAMFKAYEQLFSQCDLQFRAVEADGGAISDAGATHEFIALTDAGEDIIACCTHCDYAANLEKAQYRRQHDHVSVPSNHVQPELIHTPDVRTIAQLTSYLAIDSAAIAKSILFLADGEPVLVMVRGDHDINEVKVQNYMQATELVLANPETVLQLTGTQVGFLGAYSLNRQCESTSAIRILMDNAVYAMPHAVIGANQEHYHYRHIVPALHIQEAEAGDFRNAVQGEACPRCHEGKLQMASGLELGHVFKLGTKYSEALQADVQLASGERQHLIMGCYGIGVSRLMAAIVEQHHDEHGIVWPIRVAPYHVHIIIISMKDEQQCEIATTLYEQLKASGIDVLLDDREERPGVKFKDADLIGIPLRVIVGKGIATGELEWSNRLTGEKYSLSVGQVIEHTTKVIQ